MYNINKNIKRLEPWVTKTAKKISSSMLHESFEKKGQSIEKSNLLIPLLLRVALH